jgi:hypothetical protein
VRLQTNCSKPDGTYKLSGKQSELEVVLCNKNGWPWKLEVFMIISYSGKRESVFNGCHEKAFSTMVR